MNKNNIIQSNPEILGGTPVFVGTRVPVQTLFDYLEAGDRIDDFLSDFPTVNCEQAISFLKMAQEVIIRECYERAA